MNGWRVAVLVVIIVVFVIVASLYVTLIYMRSTGRLVFTSLFGPPSSSSTILYFRDALSQKLHSLDIATVLSSEDLRSRIAALTGRADHSGIGLSRIDEGNVLVELDVDEFLRAPSLGEAVRRTAVEPLILSRHLPVQKYAPYTNHGDVTPRLNEIRVSAPPSPRTIRRRHLVPQPYIFPHASLITTNTFIILSASAYVDSNTGDAVSLSESQLSALEWAFIRNDSRPVDLMDGCTASVHAKHHEVTLHYPGGQEHRVQRIAFRRLKYAFDVHEGTSGATLMWQLYSEPFRLPLGRYCVRVLASTDDERVTESVARVFTVEAHMGG